MPIHGSTLRHPGACTVERLIEVLRDFKPEAPVYVALAHREESIDVGPVSSVTEIRDPIQGGEVVLIVPEGSVGAEYKIMLAADSQPEPEEGEPS
jgi:hypothetical protein